MDSQYPWDDKWNIPGVLLQEHDEIRTELKRAVLEHGPIGEAAKHVARLCLPHLDLEEKEVFPAFAILRQLVLDHWRPEMKQIAPMVFHFSQHSDDLIHQHQKIIAAIENLWEAAYEDGNGEIANFARHLASHERMEDEVLYPALILIGKYLQEKLS